ncbi:hypothetical protein SAMN02799631_02235 [Methylobacterium sp. 174MFSha1.1]|uniref:hypothetical protein n=1 Tax=Methylobacterium sp. 174MFSha1.1 TaxID=1502749 RepID=UPI0008EB74FF|nr:hypothetical protein [Methylobacterium sp. 174MFSha1.1]SFU78036.1 hypothetical protein SAMN02799631_02235 [Methylobacterium sp. 174MFSha1.1]
MHDQGERLEKLFAEGFKEPYWTLEQVIAWIAYRKPRIAGAVSDSSLEDIDCERSEIDLRFWHKMIAPVIVKIEGIPRTVVWDALHSAITELRFQLKAGKIVATWKWQERERAAIPKLHWIDHGIKCNKFDYLDVKGGNPKGGSLIRLDRGEVLKLWPAETPKISAENRATELLKGLMEQSLENPAMTRDDAIQWARNQVPSLGVQAGLRAWRAAVKQAGAKAWSKAGPRSRANRNGTPT